MVRTGAGHTGGVMGAPWPQPGDDSYVGGPQSLLETWVFGGGWGSYKMKLALGSLQTAQDSVSSRPSGLSPQGGGAEKGASRGGAVGPQYPLHRGGNSGPERELECPAESQTG